MPFSSDTWLQIRDLIVHVRQTICIAGLETDLVLAVDKGGTGDNGGGSAAVDAENASLLRVLTVREPFLLQLGEDLQRDLAQVHIPLFLSVSISLRRIALERERS